MAEYPCPRCGRPTTGAYSEGGLKWAICQGCMDADRHEAIAHVLSLHPEVARKLDEVEEKRREVQDWREERRKTIPFDDMPDDLDDYRNEQAEERWGRR